MFGIDKYEVKELIEEGKKDFVKWPYSYVKNTSLEQFIDMKIEAGVDRALGRLAEDLGYEWQSGGTWVKKSKKVKKGKK